MRFLLMQALGIVIMLGILGVGLLVVYIVERGVYDK